MGVLTYFFRLSVVTGNTALQILEVIYKLMKPLGREYIVPSPNMSFWGNSIVYTDLVSDWNGVEVAEALMLGFPTHEHQILVPRKKLL